MARTSSYKTPVRKKKLPKYQSFRLTRRIKPDKVRALPSAIELWKDTWKFLWQNRVKMLIFTGVYALLYLVLVKGLNGFSLDVSSLKEELQAVATGNIGAVVTAISLYASLVSSLVATKDLASNYFQSAILIISTLSFIWLIRKLQAGKKDATVKQAFYVGSRPLVPFLLTLGLLLLMLLPAAIGSVMIISAQNTDAISGTVGPFVIGIVMLLCLTLTVYLLASSVFSIYIVTLPDASPVMAIRSSMNLLRIHRWVVLRKILAFFVLLFVVGFVLVLPFIIWLPALAEVAFFVMGCASFGVMHTYMYKLYRSMIG